MEIRVEVTDSINGCDHWYFEYLEPLADDGSDEWYCAGVVLGWFK